MRSWLSRPSIRIELDIGCGDGAFLCQIAAADPTKCFVGIDVSATRAAIAKRSVKASHVQNACVICAEAADFVEYNVPLERIDAVHLYFPSPYVGGLGLPNRLVQPKFIAAVFRLLIPGGSFRVATDHQTYYSEIRRLITDPRWWPVRWQPFDFVHRGELVGTSSESLYRGLGKVIHHFQVIKS